MKANHHVLNNYIIRDFRKIAFERYGEERGRKLYNKVCTRAMVYTLEYRDLPKVQAMHYYGQILPLIAVYKVMQERDPKNAENIVRSICESRSRKVSMLLRLVMKIPYIHKGVPVFCGKLVSKVFNRESGFVYAKDRFGRRVWEADIVKCPYHDTCKLFRCPELTHYFCDSDDICYGSMHKKVLWKRTKTLGRGDKVCNFRIEIKD